MTKPDDIRTWPWRKLLTLFMWVRTMFFTNPRPDRRYIEVEVSKEELERMLGKAGYTNDWEFSYNKRGEDLNMRKPLYKDDDYEWYQHHVRGWVNDAGHVELHAHEELEPTEYPKLHLKGVNYDYDSGMMRLRMMLVRNGVDHEIVS